MTHTALPEEVRKVLAENRARIDSVDVQLVRLLSERGAAVLEIGRAKQSAGIAIYDPKREDDVYRNVQSANAGPLSAEALKRVFERIIDEMRALERERSGEQHARTQGES